MGLELALLFNKDNDLETVRALRNRQLAHLRVLAMESVDATKKLYH